MSTFSKALHPSGVVLHDCMPPQFRRAAQTNPSYPNQTSWISVAAAKQLKAVMNLLTPEKLVRNFLMGQLVQEHLKALIPIACTHRWVRGCGGLIATNLQLHTGPGGVEYHHDRLLLPFDLTAKEVFSQMQLRPHAKACTVFKCIQAGTPPPLRRPCLILLLLSTSK
jgi:hypothetical protein